jgi:TRAP-type C4-dicarboxylate transport system permease small subunit
VAGAALLFFSLRGYFPKIYGGIEIAVGLLAIFYTADKIPEAVPEALPLLTGIYIIIRGLDNIAKNLKKDKWPIEVSNFLFNQPTLTEDEKEVFRMKRALKYAKRALKAPSKSSKNGA